MNVLVVYYSRTGYTRRIAEEMATRLGATLCSIPESGSRLGPLGYARSVFEVVLGLHAAIRQVPVDPARFDLVLIGTPVWAWHLSSPVRAFARQHAASITRTAFFCTMGGAGAEKAFKELEDQLHRAPLATLALTDREIDSNAVREKIDSFVNRLGTGRAGEPSVDGSKDAATAAGLMAH